MSIKLTFADARTWRYVLRGLADFIEVVSLKVHPEEGIRMKAMDPSHVMLVDFYIPKSAFEEFAIEKETVLFIHLENVSKILRRASRSDKLMIESDGTKLSIGLISKGGVIRTFSMPLISSTYEEVPELSLEFNTFAKTLGPAVSSALSILEDVGDVIKFKVHKEGISLTGSSELGEIEFIFNTTTGTLIDFQPPQDVEEFSNSYSSEYITFITPIAKIAETVTFRLGPELPCEIGLDLAAETKLKLYVAPRVE